VKAASKPKKKVRKKGLRLTAQALFFSHDWNRNQSRDGAAYEVAEVWI